MCGYSARKRVLFKLLGAKTSLPMGIIMINHVKRNNLSQLVTIHLGYLRRHAGCVDWLVYGRRNDKWLVMLKPVHRLAVSGERLDRSKDCWERSGWLAFWLRMSDRTDDTRQRKWRDSSTGRVFAVIRGRLEDGGPSDPKKNNHNPLIKPLRNTDLVLLFFLFMTWSEAKLFRGTTSVCPPPSHPSISLPSPLLGGGWVL